MFGEKKSQLCEKYHSYCETLSWIDNVIGFFFCFMCRYAAPNRSSHEKGRFNRILEENLKKDKWKLGLGRRWWFQHDNDPNHKAKVVTMVE